METGNPTDAVPGDSVASTLVAQRQWDDAAFRARFDELYGQLKSIARRELGRGGRGTLDTGVLVHEAYLRLQAGSPDASERGPFLALAAKAMRCVLIDHVRARGALKRGGDQARVTLATDLPLAGGSGDSDVMDIERALQSLEALEPRLATVVEYRFYAGMEFAEIADQLGLAERTVFRDWRKARAFMLSHFGDAA